MWLKELLGTGGHWSMMTFELSNLSTLPRFHEYPCTNLLVIKSVYHNQNIVLVILYFFLLSSDHSLVLNSLLDRENASAISQRG